MTVLPTNKLEQIQFCETHLPVWQSATTQIGLAAATINALGVLTVDARKAYDDTQATRQAAKGATTAYNAAVALMRDQVAEMIAQIKSFAATQSNPAAVYALAQIPEPAAPAPLPAPGRPRDFQVNLNPDGSVTLSWTAENSAASGGAFFMVSRKLPGQGGFVGIGGAPGATTESRRSSFTDATVPATAAAAGAQYIVQGFRGTRVGEASDAVVVQFGVDGAGGFTSASIRMAA